MLFILSTTVKLNPSSSGSINKLEYSIIGPDYFCDPFHRPFLLNFSLHKCRSRSGCADKGNALLSCRVIHYFLWVLWGSADLTLHLVQGSSWTTFTCPLGSEKQNKSCSYSDVTQWLRRSCWISDSRKGKSGWNLNEAIKKKMVTQIPKILYF